MNNLPFSADLIGLLVATFLTLCVFSYLLKGDFVLYRIAVAILAGGGAAYMLAIAVWNVLIPRVVLRLADPTDRAGWTFAGIGLILGMMVLFKGFQRSGLVWIGNYPIAYLIGVGTGVTISGVAFGTLFTQSQAAIRGQGGDILMTLVVTLPVLISFSFLTGSEGGIGGAYARLVRGISGFGRWMLAVAFGAIFASVYIASVSVLISRIQFIVETVKQLSDLLSASF